MIILRLYIHLGWRSHEIIKYDFFMIRNVVIVWVVIFDEVRSGETWLRTTDIRDISSPLTMKIANDLVEIGRSASTLGRFGRSKIQKLTWIWNEQKLLNDSRHDVKTLTRVTDFFIKEKSETTQVKTRVLILSFDILSEKDARSNLSILIRRSAEKGEIDRDQVRLISACWRNDRETDPIIL